MGPLSGPPSRPQQNSDTVSDDGNIRRPFHDEGRAQAQQDTALGGGRPTSGIPYGYDRDEQKRIWKNRCLICGESRHDHWKQCDRQCYHCHKHKGITGPNTHKGQPCPNTGFNPRWWKDIGGAQVGDTNWNKGKIQTQGKLIQQQQDDITDLRDDVEHLKARLADSEAIVERQKRDLHEERERRRDAEHKLRGTEHKLRDTKHELRDTQYELHAVKGQLTESRAYTDDLRARLEGQEGYHDGSRSSSARRSNGEDKSEEGHSKYRSRSSDPRHSRHRTRSRSPSSSRSCSPGSSYSTRGQRGEGDSERRSHRPKRKASRPSEDRNRSKSPHRRHNPVSLSRERAASNLPAPSDTYSSRSQESSSRYPPAGSSSGSHRDNRAKAQQDKQVQQPDVRSHRQPQIKAERNSDEDLPMGGTHDHHRTHSRRDTRRRDHTDKR